MANLNTLRDDSMADALHRHSELSASDGSPNPAVSITAAGDINFVGGSGIITGSNVSTDDANKYFQLVTPNYDSGTETEGFSTLLGFGGTATNVVSLGGGDASTNAATAINLYAAANNATRTGTLIASVTSTGVGIGIAAPASKLDLRDGNFSLTDADIVHGMTALAPTNALLHIDPVSDTVGGVRLWGLSDDDGTGMVLTGIIGSINPADTRPAINIRGGKTNGSTGWQALDASETVMQLDNYGTNLVTVLGSGNVGIGTVSPGYPLDVVTATIDGMRVTSPGRTVLRMYTTVAAQPDARNWSISTNRNVYGDMNFTVSAAADGDPQSGTDILALQKGGPVLIGTATASAFAAGPSLLVAQGANDDNALTFQASEVAHPFTGDADATTWGDFRKAEDTSGGLQIRGYKDSAGIAGYALSLIGYLGEAANTTKSTAGYGIINANVAVTNGGAGGQAVAANGNLFSIRNYNTTVWILDGEGGTWQTGGATLGDAVTDTTRAQRLFVAVDPAESLQVANRGWVLSQMAAAGAGTVTNVASDSGITGGPISTTGTLKLTGAPKDLFIAGSLGTGAFMRVSVIGDSLQRKDSDLDLWGAITPSANIQGFNKAATYTAARDSLDVVAGVDVEAWDADLDTLASFAAGAKGKSILKGATFAAIRDSLDVVVGTDVQAYDADLTTYAGITPSANVQTLLGSADFSAARTNLGLAIGTNVQAWDADLDTAAKYSMGVIGRGVYRAATAAGARDSIGAQPRAAVLDSFVADFYSTGTGQYVRKLQPTIKAAIVDSVLILDGSTNAKIRGTAQPSGAYAKLQLGERAGGVNDSTVAIEVASASAWATQLRLVAREDYGNTVQMVYLPGAGTLTFSMTQGDSEFVAGWDSNGVLLHGTVPAARVTGLTTAISTTAFDSVRVASPTGAGTSYTSLDKIVVAGNQLIQTGYLGLMSTGGDERVYLQAVGTGPDFQIYQNNDTLMYSDYSGSAIANLMIRPDVAVKNTTPNLQIWDTNAAASEAKWQLENAGGDMLWTLRSSADAASDTVLHITNGAGSAASWTFTGLAFNLGYDDDDGAYLGGLVANVKGGLSLEGAPTEPKILFSEDLPDTDDVWQVGLKDGGLRVTGWTPVGADSTTVMEFQRATTTAVPQRTVTAIGPMEVRGTPSANKASLLLHNPGGTTEYRNWELYTTGGSFSITRKANDYLTGSTVFLATQGAAGRAVTIYAEGMRVGTTAATDQAELLDVYSETKPAIAAWTFGDSSAWMRFANSASSAKIGVNRVAAGGLAIGALAGDMVISAGAVADTQGLHLATMDSVRISVQQDGDVLFVGEHSILVGDGTKNNGGFSATNLVNTTKLTRAGGLVQEYLVYSNDISTNTILSATAGYLGTAKNLSLGDIWYADSGNENGAYRKWFMYTGGTLTQHRFEGSGNVTFGSGDDGGYGLSVYEGATYSKIDAGSATFTVSSDSTLKAQFQKVPQSSIVELRQQFAKMGVYRYAWKADGKPGFGPIAQESYPIERLLAPALAKKGELNSGIITNAQTLLIQDLLQRVSVLEAKVSKCACAN